MGLSKLLSSREQQLSYTYVTVDPDAIKSIISLHTREVADMKADDLLMVLKLYHFTK